MKIGFIKDVDGYRAPVHPESIDKYTSDIYLEKGLFDYLNYSEPKNVKTISKLKELDIVACVENIEDKVVKNLKITRTETLFALTVERKATLQ